MGPGRRCDIEARARFAGRRSEPRFVAAVEGREDWVSDGRMGDDVVPFRNFRGERSGWGVLDGGASKGLFMKAVDIDGVAGVYGRARCEYEER